MKKCRNCSRKMEITKNKYCSEICYEKSLKNICVNCGEKCEIYKKYCSKKCRDDFKANRLNCQTCGKEFIVRDKWRLNNHDVKYCSQECNLRKFKINSNYFDEITPEKIITLGQLIIACHIVDYNTLVMQSSPEIMLELSNKLGSTYKTVIAHSGLVRQKITSHKFVIKLIELGFQYRKLYQDVPQFDNDLLWEGLKRTHSYSLSDDGVNVFKTDLSKVALWVCDRFGGKMVSNGYKNYSKGIMGCEWVVVWK
jgi:hypothetical protein